MGVGLFSDKKMQSLSVSRILNRYSKVIYPSRLEEKLAPRTDCKLSVTFCLTQNIFANMTELNSQRSNERRTINLDKFKKF